MEILQAIYTRRSIRKYIPPRIGEEQIMEIIKAAMYAPSAVNKQPWHFIVVDNRDVFKDIMAIHPYSQMLAEASHAILVCGDEQLQHGPGYWVVDCGAATENLLLAAHGLGIGAVWLGVHPREERKQAFRKLFGLPDHIQPFALISLGYPGEKKKTPDRFKPGRIRRNHW
jgi:nitroreductase